MKKHFLSLVGKAALLILFGVFMARCGGDKVDPNFTSLDKNFFASCGNSSCHTSSSASFQNENLDMSASKDARYSALIASNITYNINPGCNGIPIVKPGDYDHSLIKALGGTDAEYQEFAANNNNCRPTRFTNMPIVMSDDVKTAIQTWVAAGAQNN